MSAVKRLFFPAKHAFQQREQLVEILKNLRSQIPLLHAASLVNIIGLHVATGGAELRLLSPITALTALIGWRMVSYLVFPKPLEDEDEIRRELIRTFVFTTILCIGFSVWAQVLITQFPEKTLIILLYSILGSLGVAYGLSSFPHAALLPIAILGLPVSLRLMLMGGSLTTNIGLSVLIVLILLIRLLHTHSETVERLVNSRLSVAKEHNRAISAEVAAIKRADVDALTGLANRGKLVREIRSQMILGDGPGSGSVLAFIDLDGFKSANDAFGHAAGDAILKSISQRLKQEFANQALVARVGGDEFAVFWKQGLTVGELTKAGNRICALAGEPIEWEGKSLAVGTSCGLTEAGPNTTSDGEFLRQADSALYEVKGNGRGFWRLYDEELFKRDQRKATLERLLSDRNVHEDLTVEFQPIFCMKDDKPVYAEALARWTHDRFGSVSPNEFIQLAEQLGTISPLNETLLKKAIAQTSVLPATITLSFNLSALQINHKGAAQHLMELMDNEGFPARRIMFEVTETAFLADLPTARAELQTLRAAGCQIALDDFGSGHASVSYLTDLVFDLVKLDGTLIANIQHCAHSRQILMGLVNLCHAAGAKCVAEHIETEEQYVLLRSMGCDFAQGFYLGRPTAAANISDLTQDNSSAAARRAS